MSKFTLCCQLLTLKSSVKVKNNMTRSITAALLLSSTVSGAAIISPRQLDLSALFGGGGAGGGFDIGKLLGGGSGGAAGGFDIGKLLGGLGGGAGGKGIDFSAIIGGLGGGLGGLGKSAQVAKLVKTEEVTPRVKKAAKREYFRYGPLMLPPAPAVRVNAMTERC
jgi:hypothetical protein